MNAASNMPDAAMNAASKAAPKSGPILISGCPRSGTTFVGRIFESSSDIFEVYEPFNNDFTYNLELPARFYQVTNKTEPHLKPRFDRMMSLASRGRRIGMLPRGAFDRLRPEKDMAASLSLKKLIQNRKTFASANRLSVKDPLAFFSSEWLAETYDAAVIIMVRHPGGVISSFLKLDWEPETSAIVDTPLPVSKGKFDKEIETWRANPEDRLGALILQWKIFTQASLDYQKLHPEWFFALHNEVCDKPQQIFADMFTYAGLRVTDDVQREIDEYTQAGTVDPTKHEQHMLKRDSNSLNDAWKKRLSEADQTRILSETLELWAEAVAAFGRF